MAKHRSIKEQLRQLMTQEEEDFLGRIGIVLHGTKAIAEYMERSPGTISKWRTRYRGREEYRLCFPAMLMPTGKGWGFRMVAHTALIKEWIDRWGEIDCAEAQAKAKWKRKPPKVKRLGETRKELAGQFGGGDEKATREAVQLGPTTLEELSIPKSDVIALEEDPRPIVNEGLPPTTQPHPALTVKPMCTCGTLTPCIAHD